MPRNREEADLFFCSVTSLQKCETRTQKATEEIKARYQRELEVTLKHTRALKQRRANYNYGAKEDLDLQSVRMAIDFANSRTPAWPNWCPDWYPYTPVYPSFYCNYPFYGRWWY